MYERNGEKYIQRRLSVFLSTDCMVNLFQIQSIHTSQAFCMGSNGTIPFLAVPWADCRLNALCLLNLTDP